MTHDKLYFREYYQRQDHQEVEAASVEVDIYQEWDEAQEAFLEEVVGIEEEVRMQTIYSVIIPLERLKGGIPSPCVNNNYINDFFQVDEAMFTFKHPLTADHRK